MFNYNEVKVSNRIQLFDSSGKLNLTVKLLPYPEKSIYSPFCVEIDPKVDRKNEDTPRWCMLCLQYLNCADRTKAHVLPKLFRKSSKYAFYNALNLMPYGEGYRQTAYVNVKVNLSNLYVFICESCRRKEKRLDDAWNNVLRTNLPFSHQNIAHRNGAAIKQGDNHVFLPNIADPIPPDYEQFYVIGSQQPILIQAAKLKASFFLKTFTASNLGQESSNVLRERVKFSNARITLQEVIKQNPVKPRLLHYGVRPATRDVPKEELHFIQQACREQFPISDSGPDTVPRIIQVTEFSKKRIVFELVPLVRLSSKSNSLDANKKREINLFTGKFIGNYRK